MPRKSKALVITDQQQKELEQLLLEPNKEVVLHARIILACAKENQNKLVAEQLGTSETNVRNWKEAFRRDGISAIRNGKPSGRPAKENTAELPEAILVYIKEHPDTWTAKLLSEELSVPLVDIYHALKKMNITPNQRARSWIYQTKDLVPCGKYVILGIYLSSESAILVIGEMTHDLSGYQIEGRITTKNAALATEMRESREILSLGDTITAFSLHSDYISRGDRKSSTDFLQELLKLWLSNQLEHLEIFCYGGTNLDVVFPDSTIPVTFHQNSDSSSWIGELMIWQHNTCPEAENLLSHTISGIIEYRTRYTAQMEPVLWMTSPDLIQPVQDHPVKGEAEKASDLNEIDNQLEQKVGQRYAQGAKLEARIGFHFDASPAVYRDFHLDTFLPSPENFDLSTLEGFEYGINAMDDAITSFARKVDMESRKFYLDELKKNINQ